MPTPLQCLKLKARKGRVDPRFAKNVERLVDDLKANGAARNDVELAQQALDIMRHRIEKKKVRTALQIQKAIEIENRAANADRGVGEAMVSILSPDIRSGQNPGESVWYAIQDIRGEAHALFMEGLDRFRPRALGLYRDKATMRDFVRERFNESTGNQAAKEIADAYERTTEYLRQRANAAGADIAYKKNWGMSQTHDSAAIGRAGMQKWIDDVMPRLDRTLMTDSETGMPFTDDGLRQALEEVYDSVVSHGLNKLSPGQYSRPSKINRLGLERFLQFKSADDWMFYHENYGGGDLFHTIVGHMDHMARDIALFEHLGPDPDASVRLMNDLANKETAVNKQGGRGKLYNAAGEINLIYNEITGRTNSPSSQWWADANQGLRNVLASAQLGGAFISAITDLNFQNITSGFNGLNGARVIGRAMKMFFSAPWTQAESKLAIQLGLVAEDWASMAIAQARWTGELTGPQFTRRVSDTVLRATFLTPWTQAGRHAFGLEFLGHISRQANRGWNKLQPETRRAFERIGLTEAEWDAARSVPLRKERGADFMSFASIAEAGYGSAARKLKQLILMETDYAVPTPNVRVRAQLKGGTQAGSFWGETLRNASMYKSFPITLMHTHLWRAMHGEMTTLDRLTYVANLVIATTIFGGIALEGKQLVRGKDPIDPFDTKTAKNFWMAAAFQGGGLGIFGDFMFADQNRFGGSMAETLAGPVYGSFLPDLMGKLVIGNAQQLVKGEDTDFSKEAVRFLGRYTPGSSIWYTRLALERKILDQLQKMSDPEAYKSFRRQERQARTDYGQRFWWRPGELSPDRPPDFEGLVR